MLKAVINQKEYDALNDTEKSVYIEDSEDKYVIGVAGMVPKSKLDEFRDNNIELNKKLEGVDLDEYNRLREQEQKLKEKKLLDAGKVDELVAEKTQVIVSDFEAKLDNLTKALEDAQTQIQDRDNKILTVERETKIHAEAQRAMNEAKIRPEVQDIVMSDINAKFTIVDGQAVAMDGDKIMAGSNGNLTISEHISGLHDSMKMDSAGGHGRGGMMGGNQPHKSSIDKIASGIKKGL